MLLLRNAALAVVAAVATTWGANVARLRSPGIPTGADVLPLAFAVVGFGVAGWTVARSVRFLGRRGTA